MRWLPVLGAAAVAAVALAARRPRYSFRGKTVLITGGARGLGLLMARQLAAEGATLVLVSRTAHQLERAEQELRARGESVYAWTCDVRDQDALTRTVDRVVEQLGRIDVLINNAGVIQGTPWEHATLDDYQQSLQVHFWAPLVAMRAAVPHMKRQGGGRIINVSSIGGRVAIPHLNPYGAGKAALVVLSDGVRAELAKDRITVTTATPGLMRTGSQINVDVRGQHEKEAGLFSLMTATPLTAMQGERAARQILDACRHGRAQVTPGSVSLNALSANVGRDRHPPTGTRHRASPSPERRGVGTAHDVDTGPRRARQAGGVDCRGPLQVVAQQGDHLLLADGGAIHELRTKVGPGTGVGAERRGRFRPPPSALP